MAIVPHETVIRDASGTDIRYECVPLGFAEAFDLGLELADMIGGPLGAAFASVLEGGDANIMEQDIDPSALMEAAAGLPRQLLKRGGSELAMRLLRTVIRYDIDPDTGEARRLPLREPRCLDEITAAGGLLELLKVLGWILQVNYGPFFTAASGALGLSWGGLSVPSKPTPAAVRPKNPARSG